MRANGEDKIARLTDPFGEKDRRLVEQTMNVDLRDVIALTILNVSK